VHTATGKAAAAADGSPVIVPASSLALTEPTCRWGALLQQRFELDPLACSTCQGAMRIVAPEGAALAVKKERLYLALRAAEQQFPKQERA